MDEKQKVISTLRALLVFRKDPTPLRELKYDYCKLESTNEIPYFEHKSLVDFLISSGEFSVNVEPTGLVTVREKPKSISSHLKKATEQKTRSVPGSAVVKAVKNFICKHQKEVSPPAIQEVEMTEWNASAKNASGLEAKMDIDVDSKVTLPAHASKPSTVFTFSQLNHQLNPFIEEQNEPEQEQFNETVACNHRKMRTNAIRNNTDRSLQTTPEIYQDAFNKLNRMCITFTKSLSCDGQNKYRAVLQIDHVQYFGEGNTSDEANDNAASKYLHSFDTGVHQKRANRQYLNDVVPNLSIIKLCEMYDELNYRTVLRAGERNKFKTTIQVDSINYYGNGKSFHHAAAAAADVCLQSIKQGHHSKLVNSASNLLHSEQS